RDQVGGKPRDLVPLEEDPPAPHRREPQDALDRRRLPAAVPAQQADRLSRPDVEGQTPQDLGVAVERLDAVDHEQHALPRGRHRAGASSSPPGRRADSRPRYASRTSALSRIAAGGPSAMTPPRWRTATW